MSFMRPMQAQANTARRNAYLGSFEALMRRIEREDAERFIQEHRSAGETNGGAGEQATRRAEVAR